VDLTGLADLLELPGLPGTLLRVEGVMTELVRSADPNLADPCFRILRGGKRVRPALVVASAACGTGLPDDRKLLGAAAAVEFLHIASLVHDDIMDNATDRRGVTTISFLEGPSTAILCGDVLFALCNYAAALVGPEAALEAAETIVALCNGQAREMADNFDPYRSEASIFSAMEGKTAALLRTSCRLGGLCAALDEGQIDALGDYGHAFGMSFQLIDDVLDFLSSQAVSGKPVLNDLRCGVYTLPVALARACEHGDELLAALAPAVNRPLGDGTRHAPSLSEAQVDAAAAILRAGEHFRRVLDLARSYAVEAAEHLTVLSDGPTVRGLARLPGLYIEHQMRTVSDLHALGLSASVHGR
jgi:heptaprenyl diphosphate synthase/octaprenyl-diphosphate synthase